MKLDDSVWVKCIEILKNDHTDQEVNTWIRPLQLKISENQISLLAPNRFVLDWVKQNFLIKINTILSDFCGENVSVLLEVGSRKEDFQPISIQKETKTAEKSPAVDNFVHIKKDSGLNNDFTFENFVKGKSNEFACAAAHQVASKPGEAYNPLLSYGGVGLGKTHLVQSIAHEILKQNPRAKVQYLHSERFVANMVRALQTNSIDTFKNYYRSVDALLIDDIQFFAGKDRSQEEFFHTFNELLEEKKQIILTCDRYPKEIQGLKERLQSRFGWGLTVAIEPPELETRVAILISKAEHAGISLSQEVAFFIAKRIRSNVRELEGGLKRVMATAEFMGRPITVDFVKEALRDLIVVQDRLVTTENIQRTVAEYYKIKLSDLLGKRRHRSLARPRQMAMALTKELTSHSLPEIGNAFGGRDHTTVLHACRTIKSFIETDHNIQEDYNNLLRTLTQ